MPVRSDQTQPESRRAGSERRPLKARRESLQFDGKSQLSESGTKHLAQPPFGWSHLRGAYASLLELAYALAAKSVSTVWASALTE
jgi:hypothetical protein